MLVTSTVTMVYKPTNTTGGAPSKTWADLWEKGRFADSTIGTVPVDVHWQRDKKAAKMAITDHCSNNPYILLLLLFIIIYYYYYYYIYIYIRHFINSQKFFLSKSLCCKQNCGVLNHGYEESKIHEEIWNRFIKKCGCHPCKTSWHELCYVGPPVDS